MTASKYKQLRINVKKEYMERCVRLGIELKTLTPSITQDDFVLMLRQLFKQNSKTSLKDFALLVFNWHAIGRISEVYGFKLFKDVNYRAATPVNPDCITLKVLRSKNLFEVTQLHIYVHAKYWELCPFFALGTMLVACQESSEVPMFSSVHHMDNVKGAAQHVNNMLKSLNAQFIKDGRKQNSIYTSHSMRHGSAEHSNEHPQMQTSWLLFAGGWALDQMQTLFNYIAGTSKTATKTGRAKSDWADLDNGGYCPGKTH